MYLVTVTSFFCFLLEAGYAYVSRYKYLGKNGSPFLIVYINGSILPTVVGTISFFLFFFGLTVYPGDHFVSEQKKLCPSPKEAVPRRPEEKQSQNALSLCFLYNITSMNGHYLFNIFLRN